LSKHFPNTDCYCVSLIVRQSAQDLVAREEEKMHRVHVVINPASGQPQPILNTLNDVFRPRGVAWDISLTHESGDAEKFARQAAESGADVVAAYGGDGTVMEVARGLLDSEVPLAILPGGTANLMSVEVGVPKKLEDAAEIAANPESLVRKVDAGLIGETYFLLRVGIGFAAEKVKAADRELKDRFGLMAYTIGALKALKMAEAAQYKIQIDGETFETEGLNCLIDNAGNSGVSGFEMIPGIDVSDGLLDVILIEKPSFSNLVEAGSRAVKQATSIKSYRHWKAKDIQIETDPPQLIQVDGEIIGTTPLSIQVVPGAIGILTLQQ
jgi:diacylglycerol kinase (ATP)